MVKVEVDRLYEVTMRMIVRDHEMKAFKTFKYVDPKEMFDPSDLLDRQLNLTKGTEVRVNSTLAVPVQHNSLRISINDKMSSSSINRSGNLSIQSASSNPRLKTLAVPFLVKQNYPNLSLAEYSKIKVDR